ncbi:endolytic transglycosylase MltG [Lysinibacillus sp. BW-2-10]|uniref:endolytic transglycosylase MltG n=1 Tax=Lysinibacillus sp. BW-2-10 TaxID=2590030 RepID=UPI00117D8924|nr:endolytic transglycosylase MltG [Lysinibacillus sp. BW-2-10]TSI08539.1 endolytic transglycosylase MltG [Lysinibacillus sp. BW-2-10]
MKKSSVRAFGIACFLIGALLAIGNQFNLPFVSSSENKDGQYKEKVLELEQQLEKANKQLAQFDQAKSTPEPPQNEAPQKEVASEQIEKPKETKKEEIVTGTLYIYSGLTTADVAQKIKELGVINNSVEMELFLAQPEYAKSIQIGQFELNSSMSIEEIANIVTGKKE